MVKASEKLVSRSFTIYYGESKQKIGLSIGNYWHPYKGMLLNPGNTL